MDGVTSMYVVDEKANIGVLFGNDLKQCKIYLRADLFNWRACAAVGIPVVGVAMENLSWRDMDEYREFLGRLRNDPMVAKELAIRVKGHFTK